MARNLVLIGASGRVGSLLRAAWRLEPPKGFRVLAQFRRKPSIDGDVIVWDPLTEALPAELSARASQAAMVVVAGRTPGPGVPLGQNTDIALGCLAAARTLGIRRVLIASSSAVYGAGRGLPISESCRPAGANAYGEAKLAMESAVADAAGDLDVCCMRIGNVLGADALLLNSKNATPAEPLQLDRFESGGGPVRSYIDPQTLAAVLVSLAGREDRLPPIVNVASPRPISMQAIAEAAGIPWRWRLAPVGAHERIVLDCSALEAVHAFRAEDSDPSRMLARLREVRTMT